MTTIDHALQEFQPQDKTVRLLHAVFGAIPGAPPFPHYPALGVVIGHLGANANQARAAAHIAKREDLADVLWMSRLLDTGDKGYAILTGVKSAFRLFFGDRDRALETDDQQRNDAVLKALGIAYMAYRAFDGDLVDRARAFQASPAGQAILIYYAAVEVGLPFADNALTASGDLLSAMLSTDTAAQARRLASMAGGRSLGGASEMLQALSAPLTAAMQQVSPYISTIASSARQHIPGAISAADKAAGLVAAAADVMPVYRLLGARLAAEASVLRAMG